MFFLRKKQADAEAEGDIVILINEREIQEIPVDYETEDSIHAADLLLPKADAEVRYFPQGGRAFIFGHTGNYLAESENIARLEKTTVLRNLFDYGATNRYANIQFYVMMAVIIIIVFLLRG